MTPRNDLHNSLQTKLCGNIYKFAAANNLPDQDCIGVHCLTVPEYETIMQSRLHELSLGELQGIAVSNHISSINLSTRLTMNEYTIKYVTPTNATDVIVVSVVARSEDAAIDLVKLDDSRAIIVEINHTETVPSAEDIYVDHVNALIDAIPSH